MALTDNGSDMVMPVQPMNGGYGFPMMGGYNSGFGFGGDGAWIILFLIAAMFGGFGGGWGGMGGMMMGNEFFFPWLLNGQNGINTNTNAGFNQAETSASLNSLASAVNSGFSSAEVAACNRAADAMQTAYTNQIADLERSFAAQTAATQGMTDISSQLASCCCENRLATANLGALVQQENCADREALSNGIRDIISNQTAGIQRILDTMCQDKIDAKNERIASLENQVNMQALAASQAAQTAALVQDNTAQTRELIQRVAPYPIPSYTVGNPYGYYPNYGYGGCGLAGFNGIA